MYRQTSRVRIGTRITFRLRQKQFNDSIEQALRHKELWWRVQTRLHAIHGFNRSGSSVLRCCYVGSRQLGSVPPDEFIPIAEQQGCSTCRSLGASSMLFASFHKLQAQFDHSIQLSINLSSAGRIENNSSCGFHRWTRQKSMAFRRIPIDFWNHRNLLLKLTSGFHYWTSYLNGLPLSDWCISALVTPR